MTQTTIDLVEVVEVLRDGAEGGLSRRSAGIGLTRRVNGGLAEYMPDIVVFISKTVHPAIKRCRKTYYKATTSPAEARDRRNQQQQQKQRQKQQKQRQKQRREKRRNQQQQQVALRRCVSA